MRHCVAPLLAALTVLFTAQVATAQTKIGVQVSLSADDPIGRRLGFYLRDEVHKSGTFQEVFDDKSSVFKLSLVTMDPTTGETGHSTVYSYAILVTHTDSLDGYITSIVGVCGEDRVQTCAAKMLGNLGEQVERMRQQAVRTGAK